MARALASARSELIQLLRDLPESCRQEVLDGAEPLPDEPAHASLGECCERLRSIASRSGDVERLARLARRGRRLWRQMERQRETMITANLRLVVHVAKKFANRGVPFMDLIQEGNLGLMRAVEKYDVDRGFRFSTYAHWWIQQSIDRSIAEKSRLIRVPVRIDARIRKIRRAVATLQSEGEAAPTAEKIAEHLGLDAEEVSQLLEKESGSPQPLDSPGFAGGMEDTTTISPLQQVTRRESREAVLALFEHLSPRERRIVRLRYGFGGGRVHTLEEIGEEIDLSRERVRQILRRVLRKIAGLEQIQELREEIAV